MLNARGASVDLNLAFYVFMFPVNADQLKSCLSIYVLYLPTYLPTYPRRHIILLLQYYFARESYLYAESGRIYCFVYTLPIHKHT